MFTGIIESIGVIDNIDYNGKNITFTIESEISNTLKIDQSVSHNGVCLTVIDANKTHHKVTAVKQTLDISNLKFWQIGTKINLERCLKIGDRLDGHYVQGHVDDMGEILNIINENGSFRYQISLNNHNLVVNKGSIAINGISLTIAHINTSYFEVVIIPYTYDNTNIHLLSTHDFVNIEYDILGKYIVNAAKLYLNH